MEKEKDNSHKNKVHKILARSYFVYFLFFLIGVGLDLVFNFEVFDNNFAMFAGVLLLAFGTVLIIWAQNTSRNLKKENISRETFSHGPYRFTRTPTNFGLLFLMLGFGIIINAFFVVLFTVISFFVAKFIFLDKQEKILEQKYGTPYLEYKKSIKF